MINFRTRFSYFKTGTKVITNFGKEQIYDLFILKYPNVPIELLHQIDELDYFFWSKYEDENPTLIKIVRTMMRDIENYLNSYGPGIVINIFKKQQNKK